MSFLPNALLEKSPEWTRISSEISLIVQGVVGAGTMGGGITMNFANAGIPVTVVEQDSGLLGKGLSTIQENYAATVAKGRLTQEKMDERLSLITGSTTLDSLVDADIVIEAIYEEMPAKKELFGRLNQCC